MNHSQFLAALDVALLSGQSTAVVARTLGINQVTVRRRKSTLRAAGHTFPAQGYKSETLRDQREALDADKYQ